MGNVCICLKDESSSNEVEVVYNKEGGSVPPPPRLGPPQVSLLRTAGNGFVTHETPKEEAGFFQELDLPMMEERRFSQEEDHPTAPPPPPSPPPYESTREISHSQQNATLQNILSAPAKSETIKERFVGEEESKENQLPTGDTHFKAADGSELNKEVADRNHPAHADKPAPRIPSDVEIDEESKKVSENDLEQQMRDMIDGLGMK